MVKKLMRFYEKRSSTDHTVKLLVGVSVIDVKQYKWPEHAEALEYNLEKQFVRVASRRHPCCPPHLFIRHPRRS
jgi:hypothetical protein